jgi:hypothetical protein
MSDELTVREGYQPAHQFISFVEGSASTPPDESSYPLQVLGADHNLNYLDGGDPTEGFSPWVTDILVYPSSEYWESLLEEDKVRPYFDLSISQYNTLRIPSAVHDYNLFVDDAVVYGNLRVDGETELTGEIQFSGSVTATEVVSNDGSFSIKPEGIRGVARTKALVQTVDIDFTFDSLDTGAIYHAEPISGYLTITLPPSAEQGAVFTVVNTLEGKTIVIQNLVRARGNILTEQYSSATVYYSGDAWYAFGDLV